MGIKLHPITPSYDRCIFCEQPNCDVIIELDGMFGGLHMDCAIEAQALEELEPGTIDRVKREGRKYRDNSLPT